MKKTDNTKSVHKIESQEIKHLEGEIARLEENIKELALTVDKVEDEKLEVINQLKRALADYQNLEANAQKRLNLSVLQFKRSLAEKIIPTIDDMAMALKVKGEMKFDERGESWASGVVELISNLEKALAEIGLQRYVPEKNSKFDPSIHEALSTVEGENEGEIYDVIQPGYMLDDIVIRPSRVVVVKSK